MPELPEVRVVSNYLNEKIKGNNIVDVEVLLPKLIKNESKNMFIKKLTGRKIVNVGNLGKFIIFKFDNNTNLISHLRMEGKYRVEVEYSPQKHDYVVFKLNNKYLIYNDTRQFGTFHYFQNEEIEKVPPLNKLANEPQNTDVNALHNRLTKKNIAIKSALLDQTLLVGLGNIYVNEVLWHAKVHPTTPSNQISLKQLKTILDISTDVMNESTKMGGTTIHSFKSINDVEGNYQDKLRVHGREHKKCYRCKTMINKIKVNGRGTYFCPKCQKINS